jgi:hypothetical protein
MLCYGSWGERLEWLCSRLPTGRASEPMGRIREFPCAPPRGSRWYRGRGSLGLQDNGEVECVPRGDTTPTARGPGRGSYKGISLPCASSLKMPRAFRA